MQVLTSILLAALLTAATPAAAQREAPKARAGVLDLSGWSLARDGIVDLSGDWDFSWGRFEDPGGDWQATGKVDVPAPWNKAEVPGGQAGADGHGSYRLRVECRETARLALVLPIQHSAARYYVNGRLLAEQGSPGASRELARPAFVQLAAPLEGAACPLRIVAHVSNYDMRNGGLLRSIELGTERQLVERRERGLARDLFALGAICVLSLLPMLTLLWRREDLAPLWLGVYGISSAFFIGFGGERLFQPFIAQFGWQFAWKFALLSALAGQAAFPAFLRALYPEAFPRLLYRGLLALAGGLALLILFTPTRVFTEATPVIYLLVAAVGAAALVVPLRAALLGRRGAWLLLAGGIVLVGAVAHDTVQLPYQIASKLIPYGLLAFSLAPLLLLARRFTRALEAEKLRDQMEYISGLLDSLPVAVAMRDAEGRYLLVNRRWEEYFDTRRDEVVGRSLRERASERMANAVLALDRAVLERGAGATQQQDDFEYRGRKYSQTRSVMADQQGRVLGVLVASIDTTERAAMQRDLESEQRRLDLVIRAQQVGIVDWDGLTHATFYSRRFKRILGHARDADTSAWPDYFKVLIHPDDRERVTTRWRAFVTGKSDEGRGNYYAPEEYRLLRADGSYVWVEVAGVAVRDERGKVVRWIAAVTDVTERREQREALARQRERLELLLRSTKAGFMDWNAVTDETLHSSRFKELLGFPGDADLSQWRFMEQVHPEDRDWVRDAFRDMLRKGAATGERLHGPLEYRLRKADGSYLWVRGEGVAQIGEDGRTERFLTSYIDITHLREMNLALEESVRLREEVDRIGRHDLKTPLNSIIGVPRLLRDSGRLSAEDAELLAFVEQAGYRLLHMVNLSLDMFQMERGNYPFTPKAVDLNEVLGKVARDVAAHARSKRVSIRVEGPALHAQAEELLCYSMFANLVKNAVEASDDGGAVSIRLSVDASKAQVAIHNLGTVPQAVRARFFDKYSTSGKQGGSGLGTYSARLMARTQQGEIEMETSDAAGTTLRVRLMQAAAPPRDVGKMNGENLEPAPLSPQRDLSVLVVDDDEYTRIFVQRSLPASLRTSTAVNGREAFEAVQNDPPDVIVMDLDMPVMGGLEAAALIREWESGEEGKPGRARLAMIAMSSNDGREFAERAAKAGFDRYLAKPVSPDAMWRAIADLTRNLAAAPAPGPGTTVRVKENLRSALPGFLASRRELAAELSQAIALGKAEEARARAHKLAGSLALYGFQWAAAQGKMIEGRAGAGALEGLAEEIAALRRHLDSVRIECGGQVFTEASQ